MQLTLNFDSFEGKMLKNGAVFMVKAVQKQLDKDREKNANISILKRHLILNIKIQLLFRKLYFQQIFP